MTLNPEWVKIFDKDWANWISYIVITYTINHRKPHNKQTAKPHTTEVVHNMPVSYETE